jgi:tRNA nucleotidyltransferase (CCA-adding enzyme)
VRYEQRNSFQIEERTLQLLMEARPLLHRVSGERIRHELDHIIDEPGAIAILARLQELGLLAEIHKALAWDEWLAGVFTRLPDDPPEAPWQAAGGLGSISFRRALAYAAWLIRLPGEQAGELLDRLAFPRSLSQALLQAGSLHQALPSLAERPPSQVVARLEGIPHLALYAAWLCAEAPASRLVLERYIHEWQAISPTVNGNTLRALGLPPGPRYNRILNAVRNAWLDGQVTDSAGEAALLRRLMQADDR